MEKYSIGDICGRVKLFSYFHSGLQLVSEQSILIQIIQSGTLSLKVFLHFTSSIISSSTKPYSSYKNWFPQQYIFIVFRVSIIQRFPVSEFDSGIFVEHHISICNNTRKRLSIFPTDSETLLFVCGNSFHQNKYPLIVHHLLDNTVWYVHVFHWNHLTKLRQRVDVLYLTAELRAETQKQHVDFPPQSFMLYQKKKREGRYLMC